MKTVHLLPAKMTLEIYFGKTYKLSFNSNLEEISDLTLQILYENKISNHIGRNINEKKNLMMEKVDFLFSFLQKTVLIVFLSKFILGNSIQRKILNKKGSPEKMIMLNSLDLKSIPKNYFFQNLIEVYDLIHQKNLKSRFSISLKELCLFSKNTNYLLYRALSKKIIGKEYEKLPWIKDSLIKNNPRNLERLKLMVSLWENDQFMGSLILKKLKLKIGITLARSILKNIGNMKANYQYQNKLKDHKGLITLITEKEPIPVMKKEGINFFQTYLLSMAFKKIIDKIMIKLSGKMQKKFS